MKRILWAFAAVPLVLAGCGKAADNNANTGDNPDDSTDTEVKIKVSGTAELHPAVADYYAKKMNMTPPKVDGLHFEVQEPFLAFTQAKNAVLATVDQLPAGGAYAVPDVSTKPIVLGLIGVLSDTRSDTAMPAREFIKTSSALYEGKPTGDVASTHSYGVTIEFMKALTTAVGTTGDDLEKQGFILGYVRGADGKPVADVSVEGVDPTLVKYINADYTGVQADKTSATGLFVIPGRNDPKDMDIAGHAEFKKHKAGSAAGSAFNLVFQAQ